MDWSFHIAKQRLKLVQYTVVLARVYRGSFYKPVSPIFEIYKAQALGATLYGAELWRYKPVKDIV